METPLTTTPSVCAASVPRRRRENCAITPSPDAGFTRALPARYPRLIACYPRCIRAVSAPHPRYSFTVARFVWGWGARHEPGTNRAETEQQGRWIRALLTRSLPAHYPLTSGPAQPRRAPMRHPVTSQWLPGHYPDITRSGTGRYPVSTQFCPTPPDPILRSLRPFAAIEL
jgi:hypothetical protein